MDVLHYLRFYSELGVTHLRVTNGCGTAAPTGVQRTETSATAQPRDSIASAPAPLPAPVAVPSLEEIRQELGDCRRCKLAESRTHLVFGTGNPHADLMFIGEAPGEDEDLQGFPFVGRAGQLLTKIIEAIGLKREQVYIANVLKCRPPDNRSPLPDEVASCRQFLLKQITAVGPMVVVALGRHAAQTVLETETAISSLRGKFFAKHGTEILPTFHPSYLLRNPSAKREVWKDIQTARDRLKELGSDYYR
jgi:uracil-DNA glycosylase